MAAMAAVPERRARFTEAKHLAILTQPIHSSGWLHYRRPDRLEKFTETPLEERLLVAGDSITLETAAEGRRAFNLADAPELRSLVAAIRAPLAGDLPTLTEAFTLTSGGTLAGWWLDLTPKEPRIARFLRHIRLEGAGTDMLATRSEQANGDILAMQIRPQP